jgi:hypothetical protein
MLDFRISRDTSAALANQDREVVVVARSLAYKGCFVGVPEIQPWLRICGHLVTAEEDAVSPCLARLTDLGAAIVR